MRLVHPSPAGVSIVDVVCSCFTSSPTWWFPSRSGRFGRWWLYQSSEHGGLFIATAMEGVWDLRYPKRWLGGGSGSTRGWISRLRCERLAAMAAWAVWRLAV